MGVSSEHINTCIDFIKDTRDFFLSTSTWVLLHTVTKLTAIELGFYGTDILLLCVINQNSYTVYRPVYMYF